MAHERFREAGLPCPEYFRVPVHVDLAEAVRSARFPCVLKPLGLSGSRGVIRANNEAEFVDAFNRICAILNQPEVRRVRETEQEFIQIEEYIPGREFALEGLVTRWSSPNAGDLRESLIPSKVRTSKRRSM